MKVWEISISQLLGKCGLKWEVKEPALLANLPFSGFLRDAPYVLLVWKSM